MPKKRSRLGQKYAECLLRMPSRASASCAARMGGLYVTFRRMRRNTGCTDVCTGYVAGGRKTKGRDTLEHISGPFPPVQKNFRKSHRGHSVHSTPRLRQLFPLSPAPTPCPRAGDSVQLVFSQSLPRLSCEVTMPSAISLSTSRRIDEWIFRNDCSGTTNRALTSGTGLPLLSAGGCRVKKIHSYSPVEDMDGFHAIKKNFFQLAHTTSSKHFQCFYTVLQVLRKAHEKSTQRKNIHSPPAPFAHGSGPLGEGRRWCPTASHGRLHAATCRNNNKNPVPLGCRSELGRSPEKGAAQNFSHIFEAACQGGSPWRYPRDRRALGPQGAKKSRHGGGGTHACSFSLSLGQTDVAGFGNAAP